MDWIADILNWIAANPTWSGVLVMAIAFSESLALVGLFLPGAVMMFGIGALVGSGAMELWPTLTWAAVGAIAGDGVSFWLGRHFRQQIRVMWPFRTHPVLLNRSIDFFHRHGGKSVLLGRFIGPIRPVIPVVAGMMEMPPRRFYLVNIVSGILWAPVYVLPGMVFATSLGLAAEAATRLGVLAGTLLMVIMIALWLLRRGLDWFHYHTYLPLRRLLAWSRLHPIVGEIPKALLDPKHPEARGLTLLALLLITTAVGLATLWSQVGANTLLAHIDDYLFQQLQALRTPLFDRLMVTATQLADWPVLLPLFASVALWLILQRRWLPLFHWGAALLFTTALMLVGEQLVALPRPYPVQGGVTLDPFPSGHTLHAVVVYGFLALLIGHELKRPRWQWLLYSTTATLLTLIAFSRLYLGSDWLSDIVGEVGVGLVWISLLGLAYRHHPSRELAVGRLLLLVAVVTVSAHGIHHRQQFDNDLLRYAPFRQQQTLATTEWWERAWSAQPRQRIDLRNVRNHPLNLQYAGEIAPLREALIAAGWSLPITPDLINWITWLGSGGDITTVPVMPQVHDGHNEGLLLVREDGRGGLWSLRLWPTNHRVHPDGIPLWVGNSGRLRRPERSMLFYAPRTEPDFAAPYQILGEAIEVLPKGFRAKEVTVETGERLRLLRAVTD